MAQRLAEMRGARMLLIFKPVDQQLLKLQVLKILLYAAAKTILHQEYILLLLDTNARQAITKVFH